MHILAIQMVKKKTTHTYLYGIHLYTSSNSCEISQVPWVIMVLAAMFIKVISEIKLEEKILLRKPIKHKMGLLIFMPNFLYKEARGGVQLAKGLTNHAYMMKLL